MVFQIKSSVFFAKSDFAMKPLGLITVLAALLVQCRVQAQAAFAHFMVGNTASFTVTD
jgi:hypothetical protein